MMSLVLAAPQVFGRSMDSSLNAVIPPATGNAYAMTSTSRKVMLSPIDTARDAKLTQPCFDRKRRDAGQRGRA